MEFRRRGQWSLCGTTGLHPGIAQSTSGGYSSHRTFSGHAKRGAGDRGHVGRGEEGAGLGGRTTVGVSEKPTRPGLWSGLDGKTGDQNSKKGHGVWMPDVGIFEDNLGMVSTLWTCTVVNRRRALLPHDESGCSFGRIVRTAFKGVIGTYGGEPVQWESRQQAFCTLSSAEAELLGYTEAMTLWGIPCRP